MSQSSSWVSAYVSLCTPLEVQPLCHQESARGKICKLLTLNIILATVQLKAVAEEGEAIPLFREFAKYQGEAKVRAIAPERRDAAFRTWDAEAPRAVGACLGASLCTQLG